MKKFIILILSVTLLTSCVTTNQKETVRINAPEVPELPDLPANLSNEEYVPLFLYMIDVNTVFKEIFQAQDAGIMFTEESIQRELEFTQANIDAIKQSMGIPLDSDKK